MDKAEYLKKIKVKDNEYTIFDINILEEKGIADIKRLPFSIRILVENLLRKFDGCIVKQEDIINVAKWKNKYDAPVEIPYYPARVLMQDFTGVPAVVDLAVMRDALKELGADPKKINPFIPVELIIDHSVQVDYFGTSESLKKNVVREYERNLERYFLLKWAQKSFDNFKVIPPNSGICHQVNLEFLGRVVMTSNSDKPPVAFPDTVVGTDSHTTMINGIGVMGWGVGGIEAEAVMLGEPYYMSIPEVVGVRLVGSPKENVTATDIVLTITELLRQHNVVEKFVEFFGRGMKALSIPDRATIANMSPEYGATMGFFPVDEKTVEYLRETNRGENADLVEVFTKSMGLFYTEDQVPDYTKVVEFDLSTVEPSLAGPARPKDRICLNEIKKHFDGLPGNKHRYSEDIDINGRKEKFGDGSIVIAAIASCTNTSNPYVMLGAGLLAKKAVKCGLKVPGFVKTSISPGSKVNYLEDSGLLPYLEALGFHTVGFGCATCIGNSGPLHPEVERLISENDLTTASIISGNRNFEARIHQHIKTNYLASPMLVVAFAIAGRIDIDMTAQPLAFDPNGQPVYLKDIWPSSKEIKDCLKNHVKNKQYKTAYENVFEGDKFWKDLEVPESTTFNWDDNSTYIKKPTYFENFSKEPVKPAEIKEAKVLVLLGDSVTTDHISPAGAIPESYPAGLYLTKKNVEKSNFNSYGSRRGNHEVMMRGTFGNIRLKNRLVSPKEGSYTKKFPGGDDMFIYDAAVKYNDEDVPLIVLGGMEYGTGSSRDWAAKGTNLLGVRAVIAKSFERIHRSNLVGMGALPLVFTEGNSWESLGLDGSETFYISEIEDMKPRKIMQVKAVKEDGSEINFQAMSRLDTPVDVDYFENGGILPFVLRKIIKD